MKVSSLDKFMKTAKKKYEQNLNRYAENSVDLCIGKVSVNSFNGRNFSLGLKIC